MVRLRSATRPVSAVRHRYEQRAGRMLARRGVRAALISLAGLIGRPVVNPGGAEVGRLADVVARWDAEDPYPPAVGLVVRVGRRLAFIPVDQVDRIDHGEVRLRNARLDLVDFQARFGEVRLAHEVLDHQLVDTDGVRVVRAADLYLAPLGGVVRLVGVDVGLGSLLRRLGPTRWRTRPTPDRVLDWGAIQSFGESGALTLRRSRSRLHRLRAGELADLLEDLGREERQELLAHLEPEAASDALEEMEPEELEQLLRETTVERAAQLISGMEHDEAAEALRDLDAERRAEVLEAMSKESVRHLLPLLGYREDRAGGFMTTTMLLAGPEETVAAVRERMRGLVDHVDVIDGACVVDADDVLLDDISVAELFLADPADRLSSLVGPPWPVTVGPEATAAEVADKLADGRRSSVLVVDDDNHPLGRILADDVIDTLVHDHGRFRFPRVLS
jgi:CBS domain-containing protein